jgi:hypothetical protein
MSTLRRPLFRKRPNRCWGIALSGMIVLAPGGLGVPAQAAHANSPLELKLNADQRTDAPDFGSSPLGSLSPLHSFAFENEDVRLASPCRLNLHGQSFRYIPTQAPATAKLPQTRFTGIRRQCRTATCRIANYWANEMRVCGDPGLVPSCPALGHSESFACATTFACSWAVHQFHNRHRGV